MARKRPSQPREAGPAPNVTLDGYWEFDLGSGRLATVNDAYLAMSGYERSELLQMSVADLDREIPQRDVVASYERMAGQGPSRFRTRHRRKSGGSFPVGVTLAAREGGGGTVGIAFIHDASVRESADDSARERLNLFRTMFYSNPVCTSVTRLSDGRFIDVNDTFLRTFGYERDEVVGKDAATLGLWADPALRTRVMGAVREDGSVPGFEASFRTKKGTTGTLFSVGQLVEVSGEQCALMFGLDITPLRSAQERAAVRGAQLLSAIDNAPFGAHMYRLDPDDRLVFIGYNRKAEEMLGFEHSHLIGQTLEEAFPGNAGTETAAAYRRVAREGGAWETDEYAYDSQGISGVFEVHAFATGEMQMTVFFRDITEKRKLEVAMKDSGRKLSLALAAAQLGTQDYVVATDTRLLDETACRILGLDPAEYADKPLHEPVEVLANLHPDDREVAEAKRARALSTGQPYSVSYRVMWPDDSMHWVHSHGDVVRDDGGVVVRMLGVIEDVTELEIARRRLATTARALRALSRCNETLARASDEPSLLEDVCRVGVEQGGYRMVWVGYAQDDEDKTVRAIAFAGHEDGFLREVTFSWDDEKAARNGAPGIAIRTKEAVVVRDLGTDPRATMFREESLARGYGSVAAFPLLGSDGDAFGAIMFVRGMRGSFEDDEMELLGELATDLAFGIEALRTRDLRVRFEGDLFASNERLQQLLKELVEAMSRVVETRDPYTQGHQVRVAGLSTAIAGEMGMSPSQIEGIEIAAHLHDLGKLGVPSEILTKPTSLTDIELRLISEHSEAGFEILKDIDFIWPVAEIVLQHHERLDGSGYPRGLKGDEIMIEARILAVADVVEAMASHRPYRAALSLDEALIEIGDASRYDSEVAAACVRVLESGVFSLEQ